MQAQFNFDSIPLQPGHVIVPRLARGNTVAAAQRQAIARGWRYCETAGHWTKGDHIARTARQAVAFETKQQEAA